MHASIATERPPYVTFETRAVEDNSVIGQRTYKDVIFALITPQGSKDRIEKVAVEWLATLQEQVHQGRFRPEWLAQYQATFKAWQNDQEPPVDGTRLRDWPGASPAQIKTMTELRLRTIEDLAAANEETITRLGMGGRALVLKAQDWLKANKDMAPALEELSTLRLRNKEQEDQITNMSTQLSQMQAQLNVLMQAQPAGLKPL
jgi:hypothetical protein